LGGNINYIRCGVPLTKDE
jgi:hypothetical protein